MLNISDVKTAYRSPQPTGLPTLVSTAQILGVSYWELVEFIQSQRDFDLYIIKTGRTLKNMNTAQLMADLYAVSEYSLAWISQLFGFDKGNSQRAMKETPYYRPLQRTMVKILPTKYIRQFSWHPDFISEMIFEFHQKQSVTSEIMGDRLEWAIEQIIRLPTDFARVELVDKPTIIHIPKTRWVRSPYTALENKALMMGIDTNTLLNAAIRIFLPQAPF